MLPKVLLVNDNAATLTALKSLLTGPGVGGEYEIVCAQSGEEALRQVLRNDFAVIVLDVRMPVMDGFATAEAIHSHPRSVTLPIIFVTAHAADEMNRLKAYEKGAVDYLFTPIIPKILQTKVAVFVELKKRNLQLSLQTEELAKLNQDLRVQRLRDLERLNAELAVEVIERKKAELREHELATRDPLTGLLNRRSLLEHLDRAVVSAARRKEQFALLFLDLDKFKNINDSLGHDVGDELLRQVSARLLEAVRESDVVARLGGDEFVVLIEGLASSAEASNVAKKIAQSLVRPFDIAPHAVGTSASIGIGLYPQDGSSTQALMSRSDQAMYHAKQQRRGSIQFFHAELNAHELDRNRFRLELQHALRNDEFELYFQPRMELSSGRMVALQALPFWRHPRLGLISGQQFMAQAADCGQMGLIGDWLLGAACIQARRWQDTQSPFLRVPMAVDSSLPNMPPEFAHTVLNMMRQQKLSPSCLQLGIAESLLSHDDERSTDILREFRTAGVSLAIDSFGTGYSSLHLLKALAPDVLKIDPSLIRELGNNASEAALLGGVICIARALAMRVVAQGVANEKQLLTLRALGCDDCQGDYLTPPLQADALHQWLLDAPPARMH